MRAVGGGIVTRTSSAPVMMLLDIGFKWGCLVGMHDAVADRLTMLVRGMVRGMNIQKKLWPGYTISIEQASNL